MTHFTGFPSRFADERGDSLFHSLLNQRFVVWICFPTTFFLILLSKTVQVIIGFRSVWKLQNSSAGCGHVRTLSGYVSASKLFCHL